jgi:hypothetical protein
MRLGDGPIVKSAGELPQALRCMTLISTDDFGLTELRQPERRINDFEG